MKRPMQYLLVTVIALTISFSSVLGRAQEDDRIKANIPFDFVVGNTELKAGDYVIQSLPNKALLFRSEDRKVQQIAFTVAIEPTRAGNHERLLFRHEGDQYFLSQVWLSAGENGYELIPGIQQKNTDKGQPVGGSAAGGR
jgi:hypothetical protein